MSAIGATTTLPWMWLVSRGSGLILLVLFTAVFVMGISTRLGSGSRSMPRFAVAELHRTLALFAVALLVPPRRDRDLGSVCCHRMVGNGPSIHSPLPPRGARVRYLGRLTLGLPYY